MSLGWFDDRADADLYFYEERLETGDWDDADDLMKSKLIKNAYNRLYYDPRWELPTYAEATAAELVILKKANGEMAYYLAQHLMGEDHRKGIQAQGVIEAGVVKEKYSEKMLQGLPVPPFVEALLEGWLADGPYIGAANIERDDEQSVRTKVHEF